MHDASAPSARRPAPVGCPRIAGLALAGLLLGAAVPPARAADPFTEALQQAYAPYRAALFKTNAGDPAAAATALTQARQAWQSLQKRYASGLPCPYDRDPQGPGTLEDVAKVYAKADEAALAGRLPEAHQTLEEIRDRVAELRRRNGVITFSDAMNAYHAQMEKLLEHAPGQLAAPGPHLALVADTGVLVHLGQRLATGAPAALTSAPDFARLVQAVQDSATAFQAALHAGDAQAAQAALGQLKKPYSQLFLSFG